MSGTRTTEQRTPDHRTADNPAPARDVPIAGVVLGSLAAGVVVALVLTLVVVAGATEAVITGSTLLAFGGGWGLLAWLSTRLTTQPQRWARVPAVAMGLTGVALLAGRPGDGVLTALTWVWPGVLLAMVGWMYVAMRRALVSRVRWVLVAVLVVLAAASVGATVENVALHTAGAAPGRTYAVGGHRLHLDCRGTGSPTVVLVNGLGESSASWSRITDEVGRTTRVCAYDRAGQGWSDAVAEPQDGITAAEDLHALLGAAGEHGPYVLAGHSIGGPYALVYADRYPEQVAGMVLLDSSSPEQFTRIPSYPGQYRLMRRGLALLPTLARVGGAMGTSPKTARSGRDELSILPVLFEQSQALTSLGSRPLVVLTASANVDKEGWPAAQAALASLSTNRVHRVVDSSHAGLLADEAPARASAAAVVEVVSSVRTGAALTTP